MLVDRLSRPAATTPRDPMAWRRFFSGLVTASILGSLLVVAPVAPVSPTIAGVVTKVYVTPTGAGAKDGTSWANAYAGLAPALAAAGSGNEIWVAVGTYEPTTGTDRAASFALKSFVGIYGGFTGTETSRTQRDWRTNATILSGDIGVPGDATDNSYHVVSASSVGATAVLDGFTITGGNADGPTPAQTYGGGIYTKNAGPSLVNLTVSGNTAARGGGILAEGGSMALKELVVRDNSADIGGGVGQLGAVTTMRNTVISGNRASGASGSGAGLHLDGASTSGLVNVTITGNSATASGGGILSDGATLAVRNSIVWGNTASSSAGIDGGGATVTYSDIQGGYVGTGNIDADPGFAIAVGTAPYPEGDLRLVGTSPALDAGDPGDDTATLGTSTDLAGNPRIKSGTVDMGAYEGGAGAYVVGNGVQDCTTFTSIQAAVDQAITDNVADPTVHICGHHPLPGTVDVTAGMAFEGDSSTDTVVYGMGHRAFGAIGFAITIRDLAIRGADAGGGSGGAIQGDSVAAARVRFSGNRAARGGAIAARETVSVTDATFVDNTAGSEGGAIWAQNGAVHVAGSTFEGNDAGVSGFGGAIYARQDPCVSPFTSPDCPGVTLVISDSTFVGGRASEGGATWANADTRIEGSSFFDNVSRTLGGAVVSYHDIDVASSTFARNSAVNEGGAVYGWHAFVENSTFSDNTAGTGLYDTDGGGGAIFTFASIEVTNGTFVDNVAAGEGDQLDADGTNGGDVGAIAATNSLFVGGDCDVEQTMTDRGGNVTADAPGCPGTAASSRAGLALGALADNGGSTLTIALGTDSEARDATTGILGVCPLALDQRGVSRPQGGGCDAGAYELDLHGAYVVGTGTQACTAYTSIQAAVDATTGGTIHVCGRHDLTASVTLTKNLAFEGDSSTDTIVDGMNRFRLFDALGRDVTFRDMTLRNGQPTTGDGGAVRANNATVIRARVSGNRARTGGAIFASTSVTVVGSQFLGNSNSAESSQPRGGAIYSDVVDVTGGSLFTSNTTGDSGGAIFAYISASLRDSTFADNSSGGWGGAVAVEYGDGSVTVVRSSFARNAAATSGGGAIGTNADVVVTGSDFAENTAHTASGGAIWSQYGSIAVTDGSFSRNDAFLGGAIQSGKDVWVDGTTFDENSSSANGGAVWTGLTTRVSGATFTGNVAAGDGGAIATEAFHSNGSSYEDNRSLGTGTYAGGGAIYVHDPGADPVMTDHDRFERNSAARSGGAILAYKGSIESTAGVYLDNTAGTEGGAVKARLGSVRSRLDTFDGNRATQNGGAVWANKFDSSAGTYEDNQAGDASNWSQGGAVFSLGDATSGQDTFRTNLASGTGSAIYRASAGAGTNLRVANSTFVDNTAGTHPIGGNGALSFDSGTLYVRNVTFVGNRGTRVGAISGAYGSLSVANTIFGSTADDCDVAKFGFATKTDLGGNIAVTDGTSPCLGSAQPLSKTVGAAGDLGLGDLADNGGPTETISISDGSAAVGYGVRSICSSLPVNGIDQRGVNRGVGQDGTPCDSGAYENTNGIRFVPKTVYIVEEGGSCAAPTYPTIQDAVDAVTSGDTVHICAGTYALTATVATNGKSVAFEGDDSTDTIIDGGGARQLIDGRGASNGNITVRSLTLRNGSGDYGGAVNGNLIFVESVRFLGNRASVDGGAIRAASHISVTDASFVDNTAGSGRSGGAIDSFGGNVTVERSTFVGNSVPGGADGGAIAGSIVRASDSTFSGNRLPGGTSKGGAIRAWSTAIVTGSTFLGNSATGDGAAIRASGVARVTNSTFVDNTTGGSGAVSAGGVMDLRNVTFLRNVGSGGIGAVGGSDAAIANTIFGSTADGCSISGTYSDRGGNVAVGASSCISGSQPRSTTLDTATYLQLDALADNGGPTKTVALGDMSFAIGWGRGTTDGTDSGALLCTESGDDWSVDSLDQRGEDRPLPLETGCDAGAYENTTSDGLDGLRATTTTTQVSRSTATSVDAFFDTATVSGTSGDRRGGRLDPSGTVDFYVCFDLTAASNCPAFAVGDPAWTWVSSAELSGGTSATDGIATAVSDSTTGGGLSGNGWYLFHAVYTSSDTAIYLDSEDDGANETVQVAPISVILAYTGPVAVYTSSSTASVALTAQVSPNIQACPVTFDVTGATTGSFGPFTAWTMANGLATTSPVTLPQDEYEVTVRTSGPCEGAPDFSGVLSILPSSIAAGKGGTGGGWYQSGATPAKVSFGYSLQVSTTTSKVGKTNVMTTRTKGQLVWIAKAGWRLKATVDYSSTDGSTAWAVRTGCDPTTGAGTTTCATFSGSGVLQRYLGGVWVDPTFGRNVSFTVRAYDGGVTSICKGSGKTKTCSTSDLADYFSITMKAGTRTVTSADGVPVNTYGTSTAWYVVRQGGIRTY